MRSSAYRLFLASFLLAAANADAAVAAPLVAYQDTALTATFASWSWATVNWNDTANAHSGSSAVRVTAAAWAALFVHRDLELDPLAYDTVDFWLRGSAGRHVSVALIAGNFPTGTPLTVNLTGGWQHVTASYAGMGIPIAATVDGFWIMDGDGAAQTFYVDELLFLDRTRPLPPPGPAITVTVDPALDRRAISPLVYGVNFGDDAQAAALRWPLRRWGGNSTTRYNWQDDVHSVGADWFYFNYTNIDPAPATLPSESSADVFIDKTRAAGGEALMTAPLIGWTPLDRQRRWSFPVSVYGAQEQTECTASGFASWCNPDAGNGKTPQGDLLTADPTRTSKTITSTFVTDWMAHIASRVGNAAAGGVRLFALDNEPALWNSTHRDVHPLATTYDELWSKTVTIAAAMKAQDPAMKLLGPVSWGWCEYFYSAADGNCRDGSDRMAHGDLPWIDWYLAQAKQYETAHGGLRLIDYLDLHFYPQGTNISLSDDESVATADRRLRSLKSLYDPTYQDATDWVPEPVRLIPRMRDWVATRYPGTKLAITEYSFGNDNGRSSALAQAEALAIFGREGLDLATRWVAPAPGSRVEDAFRLYLDWNGTGGRLAGDSIRATSSDVDAVGAYAIESADGRRAFLLFNKDTAVRHASVRLASGALARPASLTRFDATHRIGFAGNVSPVAGRLELDLPARSATLAVIEGAPVVPAAKFYTVTPCRVLDTRNANGAFGGPALAAGAPRAFAFGGSCGVPADAIAVSANVTVTGGAASATLRAYPADQVVSETGVVSFNAGGTRADNAILALSQDGRAAVAFYSPAGVQVIVDVNGYFR